MDAQNDYIIIIPGLLACSFIIPLCESMLYVRYFNILECYTMTCQLYQDVNQVVRKNPTLPASYGHLWLLIDQIRNDDFNSQVSEFEARLLFIKPPVLQKNKHHTL